MRIGKRWFCSAVLVAVSVTGCGGGGGGDAGDGQSSTAVAKVEIQQTGVILTQRGEIKQLSAQAIDGAGNVVAVPVTWTSTKTSAIVVDGSGKLTATASNGSSQIVAEARGIKSAPLLALVTQPALDAILLTDAQIVGTPVETLPGAPASFDNSYEVRLTGVAPPIVGSILISSESKAVAGRVLQVDSTRNPIRVTLGLVSLRELFPNLEIDQIIDLDKAPVVISPEIAAAYDIRRSGSAFSFTPKAIAATGIVSGVTPLSSTTSLAAGAVVTNALLPLTCESTLPGEVPFEYSVPPAFSMDLHLTLEIKNTKSGGLERFVVNAVPTVTFEGGINLTAAFEGKYECKLPIGAIMIPVGGALSVLLGSQVPYGVGFEISGKLTLATVSIGTKVEVKTTSTIGIACPGGGNCAFERSFGNFDAKVTPTIKTASIGDVRFEPVLSAFGYIEPYIGSTFLKSLRFEVVKAKVGAKVAGSFATLASQLADPAYRSNYKISLDGSARVGTNVGDALKLLGLTSLSAVELTLTSDIARSPKGIDGNAVTASKTTFVAGDALNFAIKLDPTTVYFPPAIGPYNVDKVELVRNSLGVKRVVGTVNASAGQVHFNVPFTAPDSGTVTEFSAFVVTTVLPSDLLALEIGAASAQAPAARISAGGISCAVTTAGGLKCWGDNRSGGLGNGTTDEIRVPVDVVGLTSGVASVSAQIGACAVTTAGGIKCWGNNDLGQLGNGTRINSTVPVDVVGLASGATAVSLGVSHTCALTTVGGVKCWGYNLFGTLGNDGRTDSLVPVDVKGLTSGVKAVSVPGGIGLHTCALTISGGVKCWGYNRVGGIVPTSEEFSTVPVDMPGLTSGVADISVGDLHNCVVTTAGGVKCWGSNGWGQLGNGSTNIISTVPVDVVGLTSGVAAVSAGSVHTCALTTAGGVKCWGQDVGGSGNNSSVPVDVPGLESGVVAISAGAALNCALTIAGGVKCWGVGVFGDGTSGQSSVPVDVIGF